MLKCLSILFCAFLYIIKATLMEINPFLEHIKDLADRGDQLRRYL